jgi:hypothetical protein
MGTGKGQEGDIRGQLGDRSRYIGDSSRDKRVHTRGIRGTLGTKKGTSSSDN